MSSRRVSLSRFAQLVRSFLSPFATRAMRGRGEIAEERPSFSLSPEASWLDRSRPGRRQLHSKSDSARLGKSWP